MNKARGDDGIPAKLFQILKDDGINLENSTVATGLDRSFSFQFQRKAMPKDV